MAKFIYLVLNYTFCALLATAHLLFLSLVFQAIYLSKFVVTLDELFCCIKGHSHELLLHNKTHNRVYLLHVAFGNEIYVADGHGRVTAVGWDHNVLDVWKMITSKYSS